MGTSPNVFKNIMVGSHTVEILKDGYFPFKKDVMVEGNATADITGALSSPTKETITVKTPHL